MTARPTDLLYALPDLQAFSAGRACRPLAERARQDARAEARHIVRSGLRDVLDWLAAAGVHI
jgi:hypothetical protein